jgi:choline dehydrogenase-like flavoprotein
MYSITSVPQTNLKGRTTAVLAGKVVGGSSAVNVMMTVRGTAEDYVSGSVSPPRSDVHCCMGPRRLTVFRTDGAACSATRLTGVGRECSHTSKRR